MSVLGFDIGNERCVVAVATQKGVDIVLTDESLVCFGESQRLFGTAGAALSSMNPKNIISQIKTLIGCQFLDPDLQWDLKSLPFLVIEGPNGYPLILAQYLGETRAFTPTQVLGMMLSSLKSVAEKNLNAEVSECCIGIPVYFTDLQRRAVIDAAKIAGLHPLRLVHETTATAIAYGIYKTDFLPENEPLNIVFVDVGHSSMQVCVAAFKKGQLKILAHSFDRSLGGRAFDEVLFQHFATKFKNENKIDIIQNAEACLRLRAACEKLKKDLSVNRMALLYIECLVDKKDVTSFFTREEFEKISIPVLERVKKPLEKALVEAQLTVESIHSVEVVGSGSRVPAIIKTFSDFFGKEPQCTFNASESVARGCALQCVTLSPIFKVQKFEINESFPFSIALSWKDSASDTQSEEVDNEQSAVVFPKGNPIPSLKALIFYRCGTFTLGVRYVGVSELRNPAKISSYMIGPFQSKMDEREKMKVKVKIRLNLHGIVCVEAATLLEEEIEVPVVMESGTDSIKTAADDVPAHRRLLNETKVEAPKKRIKKTSLPVIEVIYGGMTAADLQRAMEMEVEMASKDRAVDEAQDKNKAIEAFFNLEI